MKNTGKTAGPMIERVANLAMQLSQRHLADYGATRSRHDFTQRQLMSCLILRAYLKTTYRGVLEVLAVSSQLRECLGLSDKLPHFTTLQKFSTRKKVVAIAQQLIGSIATLVGSQESTGEVAAMDSTGLATSVASEYFRNRTGSKCTQWVKVSVVILCASLIPVGVVLSLGPSNDRTQVPALLSQAQAVSRPATLYADGGYDAEWIHEQCREHWGVESVIKPLNHRADGTRSGKWRSQMSPEHLKQRGYGQRWSAESFFSGLKRTMGAALNARKPDQMLAEASFRILAYALRR